MRQPGAELELCAAVLGCIHYFHAWMQDAQDHDPALALHVEGNVLSYRQGAQTARENLAPAPAVRRETELLEREVQLFTIALRLCRAPAIPGESFVP